MWMAINDFYLDIMGEIDKIKWENPWSGLNFLGALAKGVVDGSIIFFIIYYAHKKNVIYICFSIVLDRLGAF